MNIYLLHLLVAGAAGFFVMRYRDTRQKWHLAQAGIALYLGTLAVALLAAYSAALYPEMIPRVFLVPLLGGIPAAVLFHMGSAQPSRVKTGIVFALFFSASTAPALYFGGPLRPRLAEMEATLLVLELVPEASIYGISQMKPLEREQAAAKLGAVLPEAGKFARIGALKRLTLLRREARSSLHTIIPLIAEADAETLPHLLGLLQAMGRRAAESAPALRERLAKASDAKESQALQKTLDLVEFAEPAPAAPPGPSAAALPGPSEEEARFKAARAARAKQAFISRLARIHYVVVPRKTSSFQAPKISTGPR